MRTNKTSETALSLTLAGLFLAATPIAPRMFAQSSAPGMLYDSAVKNLDERISRPVRICIIQDNLSTLTTRTQQLQIDELDLPISLLRQRGGEIGFGLINDNSNFSLKRLRVAVPPAAPVPPPKKRQPVHAHQTENLI